VALAQLPADPNYPEPLSRPVWCGVANYRYYRFTVSTVRGFHSTGARDVLQCGLASNNADGCICTVPADCRSSYCVPDVNTGLGYCMYPIVQVAEVEFWRRGQKVNTNKVQDDAHDGFRIVNAMDVSQTWGVYELEFFSDTSCSNRMLGGTAIASSARPRGFGHSIDHTAPNGSHATARTKWQDTFQPPLEGFELHGLVEFAFDGDETTNWWPTCENPCRAGSEWLGLDFGAVQPLGVRCVRMLQDKDYDYASFSLTLQGHRPGSGWETLTTFNAATWNYAGVWTQMSVPQGVAYPGSVAHAYLTDDDLNSSAVEIVGTPFLFDFGVEVEIDSWRWATAIEPVDNNDREHDGFTCDRHGRCPKDPIRWTLDGSLDGVTWQSLQDQSTDFKTTRYRRSFIEMQPLLYRPSLSVQDLWPDGRGTCAHRR